MIIAPRIVAIASVAFCISLIPRLLLIYFSPLDLGGDWNTYARVVENILGGCGVSLSVPNSGACVPHFGGNGLPGYPFFIVVVRVLFGASPYWVLVAQSVLLALSVAWLSTVFLKIFSRLWLALLATVLFAASPTEIQWARHGMTETLTVAAIFWLLGELLLAIDTKRLRILPISAALILAMFLRLDSVLLALPIAVVGFWIYKPGTAIRRGAVIACLVAIPLGAWSVRNLAVGLPSVLPSDPTM